MNYVITATKAQATAERIVKAAANTKKANSKAALFARFRDLTGTEEEFAACFELLYRVFMQDVTLSPMDAEYAQEVLAEMSAFAEFAASGEGLDADLAAIQRDREESGFYQRHF